MTGYMSKLQGYLYEGELVNGAGGNSPVAVSNGMIMVQNGNKLVLPSADTSTKLVCKEITTIYGQLGYRFVVDTLAKRYYFVENGHDINDSAEYDNRSYEIQPGELLRAHPLLVGEEFIISGAANAYTVGTAYGVLATGVVGGTAS